MKGCKYTTIKSIKGDMYIFKAAKFIKMSHIHLPNFFRD